MKKKTMILTLAIAMTLTIAKTGYAYYEKVINESETKKEQTTQAVRLYNVNTEAVTLPAIATTEASENDSAETFNTPENSGDTTTSSYNCCTLEFGNMFDENGKLKERAVYEQELDEYIAQGKISEDDKAYYLSLYDTCVSNFSQIPSDTEDGIQSESVVGESDAIGNDNGIAFGRDFSINLEECH
ncbi:MAG: hypothetical protein K0R92_8 [Lachnospiraceae bacterium]|jgi:hypothetical protein|nr:hypothetical protein [Lachnospiraceae bacterium]